MILHTSNGMSRIPQLDVLLGSPVRRYDLAARAGLPGAPQGVADWGMKPSGERGRVLARKLGLPFFCVEDGFLRSVGLGMNEPPLSVVVDDIGIYYDSSRPSRLEALVLSGGDAAQAERAQRLLALWRYHRVSKYNLQRDYPGPLPGRYVLAVDQTRGDLSISWGQADASCFQRMLQAALDENSDCTVLLKIHPDVLAGKREGHFDLQALSAMPRVLVLGDDAHPASLLEHAQAVYAVTSQMGFEGLLWGKRVRTFGMPFYAGWGLTQDEQPAPERRRPVALQDLVHAALVAYPRYLDPETGQRCEVERLVAWLGLQRRMRQRFPRHMVAVRFRKRKRSLVRQFFAGSALDFVRHGRRVPAHTPAIVWGMSDARERAHRPPKDSPVVRVEDGFLRSVGLGANLARPLSWVLDRRGIYYDASRPSDLEHVLQTNTFDADLLERAAALRQRIIDEGLTKYNVGDGLWQRPESHVRVILVPGQVETDASLVFGAPGVRRNMALLQAVREANPDAYLVYKPHPDVAAGLRRRGEHEAEAGRWCDEVVIDKPMGRLLDAVDEVHVLTSLAGFEALMRRKRVVAYGQPFYAGWGLTTDMCPVARRTRRLALDELVAGALILYPTYVSRTTEHFTTPERALDELLAWREAGGDAGPGAWVRFRRFIFRRVLRMGQ